MPRLGLFTDSELTGTDAAVDIMTVSDSKGISNAAQQGGVSIFEQARVTTLTQNPHTPLKGPLGYH